MFVAVGSGLTRLWTGSVWQSRQIFQRWTRRGCQIFTYPYGTRFGCQKEPLSQLSPGSTRQRTETRIGVKPQRPAADTAYGTGKFLAWLIGAGSTPHIPVCDKSTREDGTLSRSDFRWDKRRGVYICPNDKVLHTSGT